MTQPLRLSFHGLAIKEKKRGRVWWMRYRKRGFSVAALQETRDEVAGQARTGVLLRPEVLHDVGQLFPIVEGLLELRVALEQQDVDDTQLADVTVLLELLADLCADGGHGHVQRVHGLNLWGLYLRQGHTLA